MQYKDTKLIVILNSLTKEELIEFEKFISTPYFKTGRNLLPLFNELKKFHTDFSSDKFTEENIFKKLYPKSDYSDKKSRDILRTLTSSMLKSAEDFLFISRVKDNAVLKNRMLLSELLDRNLFKYFEQYRQSAFNDLKEDEKISGEDYLEKFYLERLNTKYSSQILDFKKLFEHSLSALELISAYFWLDLIRTAKTIYLAGLSRGFKREDNSADKLLNAMKMEDVLKIYEGTSQYKYLYFNYYTYLCLKDKLNTEFYEKAKKIFFENRTDINRYDKNFFYADLININMTKNKGGNFVSPEESFFLMKECLEDKAYKVSDDDFMQPDFYRNLILVANSLKEFQWADDFINKYSDELKPEFRDNMKYYSKALVQYGNGNFEESLEYISKVKYDLSHFKIDVKILMLKIFYELKLSEQAYSMCDTFRHYIKALTRMDVKTKEGYNNFLKYYLKLLKIKTSENNNEEAGMIGNQMQSEQLLSHKTWLNEKLEQIL